jgi:hypothetical protein
LLALIRLLLTPRAALIAENLFLRKQLSLFKEQGETAFGVAWDSAADAYAWAVLRLAQRASHRQAGDFH